ncbi:MAG: hypothetical protein U0232_25930 [Thermomicrobiales bacterium]
MIFSPESPSSTTRRPRPWYVQLFGREPDFDVSATECMWQLTTAGWVCIVEDLARVGHALFCPPRGRPGRHLAAIAARGLTLSPGETVPGGVRTCSPSTSMAT